ncbi:cytochrome c-type biogenesis protein CcsB [Ammonifex degensii KC4]|uniref:Heme exporter protein C n=1 Tax=Ammonifex degensii (strain DSM 10501 / KC4) TaxID=429009 RepID=C9RA24_AMMDK|nr:cytochrome c biogenesis protein CcsA [Ammonifex degensii]ACX53153.1 cytochrome c-type biogenesis protein CcsB [Ammonifex degensii KC4]
MSPWETQSFTLAFIAFILSLAFYAVYYWVKKENLARLAYYLLVLGALALSVNILARSITSGRWPFANTYEFLLLLLWGAGIAALYAVKRYHLPDLGVYLSPVLVALMAYAFYLRRAAAPLVPALQSYWLQLHVATAIVAYGAFTLAFALAVMYLRRPNPNLERLTYYTIAFGFAFQTLLLITGAVWAEEVWGAWWSWDPKETWALITWVVYALYLHGFTRGYWRGRKAAWVAVIGFLVMLFTLFGVNYLLGGLHSEYR